MPKIDNNSSISQSGPQSETPLAQQIAALRQMSGAMQLRALTELPQPEKLLDALPATDLLRLVHNIGPDLQLITMLNQEQLRLVLDLELWDEWSVDSDEALRWLEVILENEEAAARRLLAALDPELLLVVLKKYVTVGGGLGDIINSEDFQGEWDHTFDEVFYLKFADEDSGQLILKLLDLLYSGNHQLYRSLMLGVETELLSELEETAWQFRAARLADEGLPETFSLAELLAC